MSGSGLSMDETLFVDVTIEIISELRLLMAGISDDRLPLVERQIHDVAKACKYTLFYILLLSQIMRFYTNRVSVQHYGYDVVLLYILYHFQFKITTLRRMQCST